MSIPGGRIVGAIMALQMAALPMAAAAASPFANWAAVVVAGDYHAHSGVPTEAFDNARRDVTHALVAAGFDAKNIQQFSVRPQNYPEREDLAALRSALADREQPGPAGRPGQGRLPALFLQPRRHRPGRWWASTAVSATFLSPDMLSKMIDQRLRRAARRGW